MWESLKKILQDFGEKAVIIEDGSPRYVLLSIEEYMRLRGTTPAPQAPSTPVQQQPIRQTIDFSAPAPYQREHHGVNAELSNVMYEPVSDDTAAELNIEDLPF